MSSIACPSPAAADSHREWCFAMVAERLVSAILLAALSPLLAALAVVTYALSGKSPWIAHRRVGQHGTELWVLKIRTMWTTPRRLGGLAELFTIEYIDDEAGPGLKDPRDKRVSGGFARFCRRHSLDELPQLIQVLSGRMSLVGPRPVTLSELETIYGPAAREVIRVKPGLSGLWQVSGRNRLSDEQRRTLDLESARNPSPRFYFRILLRTVPEVLWGRNSW